MTRQTCLILGIALSMIVVLIVSADDASPPVQNDWMEPFPAFRIAGNLHYVGSRGLASYLVTTSEGHILINSNLEASVPMIQKSVESLGFKFSDATFALRFGHVPRFKPHPFGHGGRSFKFGDRRHFQPWHPRDLAFGKPRRLFDDSLWGSERAPRGTVPGLGDPALAPGLAAGVFRGDQPEIGHQLPRVGEPAEGRVLSATQLIVSPTFAYMAP